MANKEVVRKLKFLMFSVSAGIIQIVVFTLMNEFLHLSYWFCYLVALVCSVVWSFTFNRAFTFKSAANVPRAAGLTILFYAFFTPLSTGNEWLLADTWCWNEYLVTFINMLFNLVLEYLWDTYVVYRGQIDTNARAARDLEKETLAASESGK